MLVNCGCPACSPHKSEELARRAAAERSGAGARSPDELAAANEAAYADFLRDDRDEITHAGQCLLVNDQTGDPLANFPYTIIFEDGTEISDVTNGYGYTQLVQTVNHSSIKIKVSS